MSSILLSLYCKVCPLLFSRDCSNILADLQLTGVFDRNMLLTNKSLFFVNKWRIYKWAVLKTILVNFPLDVSESFDSVVMNLICLKPGSVSNEITFLFQRALENR